MPCAICHVRRPKRFCPGVRGDICTLCCGTEREVTVDCPLDCVYLREAHQHEKITPPDPGSFPNQDIRVTEEFLHDHEPLLLFSARTLLEAALATPGAVDFDVREALDALVRTYRTLESGVYYETRPANPLAANISREMQAGLEEFRKHEPEQTGMTRTRDADVLRVLAFLQRLELDNNNGRKRGRSYLVFLNNFFPERQEPASTRGSLIVP
ncbi:MAG TPA: hypothetical protein VLX58_01135 [Bryobacteraceae bacterium]|nr:hypothetical protein [Bryobacteraceae bacterium]